MKTSENPQSERSASQRLLTRSDVAELFGVSPSTITRWANAGKLPSIKTLGGHRRYKAETVFDLAQDLKEKATMEEVLMSVPAMYADHHVIAVREALAAMPGVAEIQASSAFKTVRVQFDANQISAQMIAMALQDAGYAPAGTGGNGHATVPVATGKKDPAWAALAMRTIETNPADIEMSGEFRKY